MKPDTGEPLGLPQIKIHACFNVTYTYLNNAIKRKTKSNKSVKQDGVA